MASRHLDDLAEPVKQAAQGLLRSAKSQGFEVLIYCTLRSLAEQAALYASGRTVAGPILTCARPGESLHNPDANGDSWAFDCVPMVGGKPQWGNLDALAVVGSIGEAHGLTWAGRWRGKLRESVHFQMTKTI
jgi:peptidoglycan LD-endopeptidase CwlK